MLATIIAVSIHGLIPFYLTTMIIPFHGSKSKAAEAEAEAEAGAECGSQYSDDASVWSMGLDHPPPYTSSATLTASGYAPAIASASATAKAYGIFPQYTTHDQPVLLSLKRDRLLSSRTDVTILRGPVRHSPYAK